MHLIDDIASTNLTSTVGSKMHGFQIFTNTEMLAPPPPPPPPPPPTVAWGMGMALVICYHGYNLTGLYPSPKSFWSCTHVNNCQNYTLYQST